MQADEHLSVTDRYIALAIQGDLQPARALLAGAAQAGDEGALQSDLATALRQHGTASAASPPDSLYAALGPAIEREGFHALLSPAPPLQDLLVWRTQQIRQFEVELTDLTRSVQVAFLSDFSSLGWKEYAALGLATTTGWVESGLLYCVDRTYQADSEAFEVSFLKHETRHLADFERFPALPSVELEYRAKLTELAFASKTLRRLLEDFTGKAAPNPASPHAEANDRVVRDVYRALHATELPRGDGLWMTADVGKVNRVARRLLEKSTRELPE